MTRLTDGVERVSLGISAKEHRCRPQVTVPQALVLEEAVGHYGRRHQILKVAEELRELAVECEKAAAGDGDEQALALERADVEVVLWQFDCMILPGLRPLVQEKLQSQVERLAGRMHE